MFADPGDREGVGPHSFAYHYIGGLIAKAPAMGEPHLPDSHFLQEFGVGAPQYRRYLGRRRMPPTGGNNLTDAAGAGRRAGENRACDGSAPNHILPWRSSWPAASRQL